MRPTRWQHLENLVNNVLELPLAERSRFLEDACRSDDELRLQVEELVASFAAAGNFLEDAIGAGIQQTLVAAGPAIGDRIGPYELTGEIGHGGMGTVFRAARADDFRQQVAIKVIGAGLVLSQELITRFRAERQILALLSHPNIARLIDGGLTPGGVPYLVMEFIEGETIDRFVHEQKLNIRARLELFLRICSATQYAHQNLIVHRDIKPANILVTADGEPKLLDFGIAKLLEPGSFGQTVAHTAAAERLMTPGYASPEQVRGEAITTATDVYALGGLLYQLLTGKPAFETQNLSPAQIERLICETSPPRPSTLSYRESANDGTVIVENIPADLDNIVMKAMHKEPGRRYVSAAELADDLRRYLQGFPITARPDSWKYRTSKFVTRHKLGVSVAALVLITIAGLVAGLIVQTVNARREARTAQGVASFLTSLFRFSRPDMSQGRNLSARDILDRGATRLPQELSGEPEIEARLLSIIGRVYYALGAYDRADSLAKQAIDLGRRIHGKDSQIEAEATAFTLAQTAIARGKYDEATHDVDTAWPILKKHNSPELANVLVISGLAYWHKGDFDSAEIRMREAIQIDMQQKGAESRDTLGAKGNLGLILMDAEKYDAAEAIQRELLAVRMRTLGPHHPDVALNTGNLGDVQRTKEQWQEAAKTYATTLKLYRDVYGPEHPRDATPLNMLAEIETNLGHFGEALSLNSQALDLSVRLVGPLTSTTGLVLLTRSWILTKQGKLDDARKTFNRGFSILAKIYPPGDRHIAEADEIGGELELAEGDLASAQRDFAVGLESRQKQYGHKGLHVASSLLHLAEVQEARGAYGAAEAGYRDAIQTARTKLPGASTTTATALFGLGRTLLAEGKPRDALAPLKESLDMRRKLLPPEHPDIAASASALAQSSASLRTE